MNANHPDPAPPMPKSTETNNSRMEYDFIHKPKHYCVIGNYDVCDIANAVGLEKDAYAFNILKYVLRKNKPGEPRHRDIEKIREYAEIWLKNYYQKTIEASNHLQ